MNNIDEEEREDAFNYEDMAVEVPQHNVELGLYEMNLSIYYNQLIENKNLTLQRMMNEINMNGENNIIQEE